MDIDIILLKFNISNQTTADEQYLFKKNTYIRNHSVP